MKLTRCLVKSMLVFVCVSCRTTSPRAVSDVRSNEAENQADEKAKIADSVATLTDLYVFPSPSRPNHLVLALNIKPLSKELPYFSERVNYLFYLREAKLSKPGEAPKITTKERGEKTIMCWFKTPIDPSQHGGTCTLQNIGEVSAPYGEPSMSGEVWLYHGLRNDPFLFDPKLPAKLAKYSKKNAPKSLPAGGPQNILSLVLEFDPQKLFGRDVKVLAVAAQSYTTSNEGRLKPLNRTGRPDIANLMLAGPEPAANLQSRFLVERPFEMTEADKLRYREKISEQITRYDQLDKQTDWNDQDRQNLTEVLADDYMLIDLSKVKSRVKYLGIEQAVLANKESGSFGGRAINEDVLNRFVGFLINRGRDDVSVATRASTTNQAAKKRPVFPYLTEPDPKWTGSDAAYRARLNLGL